jgi:type II secretory ATPase GspE/PulE/Tfp pilus assembly ATPase PilB-like protein
LVFATLHTTTGFSAIYRLLEMNLPPYMIADALLLIVNQRLVKRLCPHCHKERNLSELEIEKLSEIGIQIDKLYNPEGCRKCNYKGYNGRTLIFEYLFMNEYLRKSILSGFDEKVSLDLAQLDYLSLEKESSIKINKGIISMSDTLSYIKEL